MPKSRVRKKVRERRAPGPRQVLAGPPWQIYLEAARAAAMFPEQDRENGLKMLAHWPFRMEPDGGRATLSALAEFAEMSVREHALSLARLERDGFIGWDQKRQAMLLLAPEDAPELDSHERRSRFAAASEWAEDEMALHPSPTDLQGEDAAQYGRALMDRSTDGPDLDPTP